MPCSQNIDDIFALRLTFKLELLLVSKRLKEDIPNNLTFLCMFLIFVFLFCILYIGRVAWNKFDDDDELTISFVNNRLKSSGSRS